MKQLIYIFFWGVVFPFFGYAQEENWDVYLSKHEKGVASTMLNMALNKTAPQKNFPYVLITGVKFKDCTADGMPTKKEFDSLYVISDTAKAVITRSTLQIPAGTFTYQCERKDYYYVNDTTDLRALLLQAYQTRFPDYEPYVSIKADKAWDAYLKFLYPNEETQEYMKNEKVVTQLLNAGDKLEQERPISHWIYFSTEADRKRFSAYAISKGFKIMVKSKVDRPAGPLQLQIARVDKVQVANITRITLELTRQAKKCLGDYDGWESAVIKD
jgi:Family of unknown function (DUF695)/Regulator of ribonuclease activity B